MARSAGVVLFRKSTLLNEPPRRFAAPRLGRGGEISSACDFVCKAAQLLFDFGSLGQQCLTAGRGLGFCMLSIVFFFARVTSGFGQNYTQRGFVETRATGYPETTPADRAHTVGEALLRYEGFYKPSSKLQVSGALDLRTDTHRQVERRFDASWWDREQRRPMLSVRRLSATYHTGGLTIEAGKQFIRWGKADLLNPTDRFAPRDFLTVLDNDFLGITAARLSYERGADTVEAVLSPRFTPSRLPLQDQRWVVLPANTPQFVVFRDGGARFPGGPQTGFRWNHIGLVEFSGSFYEGFNHLPSLAEHATFVDRPSASPPPQTFSPPFTPPSSLLVIELQRFYPKMRMLGADLAFPLHWFSLKGETAYFSSKDPRADEYAQYVLQLERHSGEWTFVSGYAGEALTRTGTQDGTFAPDRGFTKTFLGTARLTIDANRSIAFDASVRQNLDGAWTRAEYSQTLGQHWRATANFSVIFGKPTDFLGQYRHNSHATLILRYSF